MDARELFDDKNGAFFARAARAAVRRIGRGPGGIGAACRNAAMLATMSRFQRRQAGKRRAAAREGIAVPAILIASVTRRCNLDCAGCYSKALRGGGSREMSDGRFLELFREAVDLGVGTLMIAGGEPLLRRSLLEGVARLPGAILPVFTNGLLLDDAYLDLFSSGRFVPVLSIEGDAACTARRRGDGIHEDALAKADALARRGIPFGFSVTLTSENADFVLSDRFLSEVQSRGASVLFLVEFVPVAEGSGALVLTEAQKAELLRESRFDGYSFLHVCLPGDEESFGGCLAAGRAFLHLADDGALEACPFAPFSDTNAADRSLREALGSPLMRAIRDRHGELTETRGGCALWNKRGWVASLGACASR